jgi:hypothetical protein
MTTTCWTIIHHAATPVARSAARIAHAVRHSIGPQSTGPQSIDPVHRAARLPHHATTAVGPPHTWVEVVCKVIPAAVAGSGLLAPHPANPPLLPAPPPAIVQPAPPAFPWLFPPGSPTPRATPVQPYPTPALEPATTGSAITVLTPVEPASPVTSIPEPSSAGLLLGAVTGVLLIRLATRRMLPDASPDVARGAAPSQRR